jgi:hypothetical protein
MASSWTDWADGSDLSALSRATNPLTSAGYDIDEVRSNPDLRAVIMQQASSPYGIQPAQASKPIGAGVSGASPRAATGPTSNAVSAMPTIKPPVAKAPTALHPSSAAPGQAAQPVQPQNELDEIGREALEKGLQLGDMASKNAKDLENTASAGNAEMNELSQQESSDSMPTPYLNPETGKVLPDAKQFAPTVAQRIGRGVKSGVIGLLTGGIPGAVVGAIEPQAIRGDQAYGAPNRAYDVVEAERQARLASDKANIGNLQKQFGAIVNARKAAGDSAKAGAESYFATARGAAEMQPKPGAEAKPVPMMVNGRPTMVIPDAQKGYLSAEPGNYGQPIQGNVQPPPKETAQAHDAFDQWTNNPAKYEQFMEAMAAIKAKHAGEKGAYGSFGPAFAAYHMLQSAYKENPALLPYVGPILAKMFSGSNMTPQEQAEMAKVFSSTPAGQPHNAAGQTIGTAMPEAPTGATRSRGQFAQAILPTVQQTEQEIQKLGPQDVGALKGRFLQLYQGKFGANDPQYAGLNFALHNIGTAWMRLHANSDSARQEFEHLLSTAQSPADLMAGLNSLDSQAQDYVKEGEGRPDELGGNKSSGANSGSATPKSEKKFDWGAGFRPVSEGAH